MTGKAQRGGSPNITIASKNLRIGKKKKGRKPTSMSIHDDFGRAIPRMICIDAMLYQSKTISRTGN
jgi:hypothetical protein